MRFIRLINYRGTNTPDRKIQIYKYMYSRAISIYPSVSFRPPRRSPTPVIGAERSESSSRLPTTSEECAIVCCHFRVVLQPERVTAEGRKDGPPPSASVCLPSHFIKLHITVFEPFPRI